MGSKDAEYLLCIFEEKIYKINTFYINRWLMCSYDLNVVVTQVIHEVVVYSISIPISGVNEWNIPREWIQSHTKCVRHNSRISIKHAIHVHKLGFFNYTQMLPNHIPHITSEITVICQYGPTYKWCMTNINTNQWK